MRLSRLALVRFRSHARRDLELEPSPGLIAISGPNGAGKTNILEAVSMLSPGRGLRGASAEDMALRPEPIGWSVRAEAETLRGRRRLMVSVDLRGGARRAVEIDGAPEPQTALSDHLRVLWLTPAMDRLWIEGAGGRRRFLDRTTLAFDAAHGVRSAAYERAMRERNRLLKEPRPDPAWLDALEARMAEDGRAIDAARSAALARITAAQAKAESAFPKADLTLVGPDGVALEPDGASSDVEARIGALRAGRRRDAAAGRTLEGPHRADLAAVYSAKGVEAQVCSTGEQKALLISIVLATGRALAAVIAAAPILLLDVIGAHLDEGRRAALYDEPEALGAQTWMTGAEASLFAGLDARAQRIDLSGPPPT